MKRLESCGGGIISASDEPTLTISTNKYIPKANTNNSTCKFARITDLTIGNDYVFSCVLSWNYTSTAIKNDGFVARMQGATYYNSAWGWGKTNPITYASMQYIANATRLTSFVTENLIWAKKFSIQFTPATEGIDVGFRTDYSDGLSWVKMTNIEIVPLKYFVGTIDNNNTTIGARIDGTNFIADNFIEY